MDDVRLPPLANVLRLFAGRPAVDFRGPVKDLPTRLGLAAGVPVAILICRGGDLDNEASKLQLLSDACKDLSQWEGDEERGRGGEGQGGQGQGKSRQLQVVLLVSTECPEDAMRAALHKLPAAFGGSMSTTENSPADDASASASATPALEGTGRAAGAPPNPQPPWVAIACVPSEAEMLGSILEHRQEMLVLLLDVVGGATGNLALFGPKGAGLPREGQVVLQELGAVAAWPYSLERIEHLEEQSKGSKAPKSKPGAKYSFSQLFTLPSGVEPGHLLGNGDGKVQEGGGEGAKEGAPSVHRVEDLAAYDVVAVYLGADWCDPCVPFQAKLKAAVEGVRKKHGPCSMTALFVSYDQDEAALKEHWETLAAPGWLALPYAAASASRDKLSDLFGLRGIPALLLFKGDGTLISTEGRDIIAEVGAEAFPFGPSDISTARQVVREQRAKLKSEQTLASILSSPAQDYLINSHGDRTPITDLVAKGIPVGVLFSSRSSLLCSRFAETLAPVYREINGGESGKVFEVVLVDLDWDDEEGEEALREQMKDAPWLALPHSGTEAEVHRRQEKRALFDQVKGLPALVIVGGEGGGFVEDAVDKIRELGAKAFPFK